MDALLIIYYIFSDHINHVSSFFIFGDLYYVSEDSCFNQGLLQNKNTFIIWRRLLIYRLSMRYHAKDKVSDKRHSQG